jgi:phospholipase/carboxylesterase
MQHVRQVVEAGLPLSKASRALIMLHGRGATAQDILSLQNEFQLSDYYIVAPQATNHTWYPYSFLSPIAENEPWLSSALHLVRDLVTDIEKAGIKSDKIYILGFSQGACLALEFATRNARKWGAVIAFTGGLVGDQINRANYSGDFEKTKVFIGNGDNDPHVPLARTQESADLMHTLGALVTLKVYPALPHTINRDELKIASEMLR